MNVPTLRVQYTLTNSAIEELRKRARFKVQSLAGKKGALRRWGKRVPRLLSKQLKEAKKELREERKKRRMQAFANGKELKKFMNDLLQSGAVEEYDVEYD